MIEDHLSLQLRYERFIKKVCETKIIFALESEQGFATSASRDYEDEDDNPITLICFWSESAAAGACAVGDWQAYKISSIALPDFMENWCLGMAGDGLRMGINFDPGMSGFEVEPNAMLQDLLAELRYVNASVSLRRYKDLEALEDQLRKFMQL